MHAATRGLFGELFLLLKNLQHFGTLAFKALNGKPFFRGTKPKEKSLFNINLFYFTLAISAACKRFHTYESELLQMSKRLGYLAVLNGIRSCLPKKKKSTDNIVQQFRQLIVYT